VGEAFAWWRRRIESKGILVFVARHVPPEEMSGFTIAADAGPAIVINGADPPARRVFSLLHELAHALLRQGGVSSLSSMHAPKIERFCNEVAARTLIPGQELRSHRLARGRAPEGPQTTWSAEDLKRLAADFGTSVQAAYLRLVDEKLASRDAYARWLSQFGQKFEKIEHKGEGGPDFYTLKIHDLGRPYLERVFDAFHADAIPLASVCDLLGVKADTARKLESRLAEDLLKAS